MTAKSALPVFYRSVIIVVTALCAVSLAQVDWRAHLDRVDFLTEYYFEQDAHSYFGHKDSTQRATFLVSGFSLLEAMLVSYGDVFHIGALYSNFLGMGRQNAAILFDPRESNYALVPFVEFRHRGIFYQTGLDHRCFHQVDRKTRTIPPYWNQIYIKASSANYRVQQMKKNYLAHDKFGLLDRFSWSVWAGYFMWQWFETDKSIISGGHEWQTLTSVDLGYALYKTNSWVFTARNKLSVYADTTGKGYWEGALGLDADIYNRNNTLGFFINYYYEFPRDMPFLYRDRMWSWGFRFRV